MLSQGFSNLRTILISGASRGIGRKIAERAVSDGHNVSLGVRNLETLKGLEVEENKNILMHKYDAKKLNLVEDWVKATNSYFGKIDTIIHSAGIFRKTNLNFKSGEEKDIEELWKVNVLGPWFLTRAAWKYLTKNTNSRIIVLVSMSGKRSKSSLAGYSASKFALMGLSQTIRNEGWNKGIRVTTICPSWVNTKMASGISSISKDEMTQPEDIASIVSKLLELPNSCIPFEIPINCNLES